MNIIVFLKKKKKHNDRKIECNAATARTNYNKNICEDHNNNFQTSLNKRL